MNLEQIIKSMEKDPEQEKTAEEKTLTPETELAAELEKAAGTPPEVSTSRENVVEDLVKMANQLAGVEKDAELSHYALCGRAFADAAISRWGEWDGIAKQAATKEPPPVTATERVAAPATTDMEALKQAAAAGYADAQTQAVSAELEKLAQAASTMSDEDLAKLAAEVGYQETLEKVAAEYKAGEDQALQEVHDLASAEFLKGAAETEILLNHYRQQQQG